MSHRPVIQAAPDYTTAFLWSSGLLLYMTLLTVAALTGLWAVVLIAWGLDRGIRALSRRR